MSLWTDEEDARLTRLYAEGLTFVQMADRLGYSKGKIAGRLHRLKLTGKRPMGRHRQAVHSEKPGPKPKTVGAARGRQAKSAPPMPAPVQPKWGDRSGQQARKSRLDPAPHPAARAARPSSLIWVPKTCQYPHGDPRDADFHFCGAPLEVRDGRPYCPKHEALCTIKWVPSHLKKTEEAA